MTWDNLARRVLYYAAYALYTGLRPPRPASYSLIVSGQEKSPVGLKFKVSVSLPPLPTDDIIKARKLLVAEGQAPAVEVPVTLTDTTVELPGVFGLAVTGQEFVPDTLPGGNG